MIDCRFMQRPVSRAKERGVTLVELLIVLSVLVALAGMVLISINPDNLRFRGIGGNNSTRGVATQNTMATIRGAIFGDALQAGYWRDMGRDFDFWPRHLEWLLQSPGGTNVYGVGASAGAYNYAAQMMVHNASTKLGWRGPYFQGINLTISNRADIPASLRNKPSGGFYTTISDAWGQPILMVPPAMSLANWGTALSPAPGNAVTNRYILSNCRLVSPGANRRFDSITTIADYAAFVANPSLAGDDVILWLSE